ncbi:Gfo/Idh/MocA family protein [Planctomicrobium sp. SH661]|uniref:Gfo/Idh/MocA family protein n=1 Tax=Planctomicrobium sp. SH661 TaxID=3448124 RepID=UPI003F5ADE45
MPATLKISRRGFLASTSATLALRPWSRVLGANSDIRVVVIGCNNIGKTHLNGFPQIAGVRVVGICDVDSQVLGAEATKFEKEHGPVKKYEDLRTVYDDPNVDAVVLAVPNHWHALGTIWACQAGKDVYVEKPCSQNIWEAGQMMKAAEKYNRIVQVGIQRRSIEDTQNWLREIREGALGKIQCVRALYYSRRQSIGKVNEPQTPPQHVNHDLWSGPAPTPIWREKYHYDWHWFWELGNGELGNNGPHVLDLARTALGIEEFPGKVWSAGGRYAWDDNGVTPNSHIVHYGYEPTPIIMEIRNLPEKAKTNENTAYRGLSVGIIVEGEDGTYIGFDGGKHFDREGKLVRQIPANSGPDGGRQKHRENFIKAVRSRNEGELNCNLKQGHLSSSLCHLGNIAQRLGEPIPVPQAIERLQSDPQFGETGTRLLTHLQANDLPVETLKMDVGGPLAFDPVTETFPQSPEANAQLKRTYRAPYIIHDDV